MEILEQPQGAVTVIKPVGPLCADDANQFRKRAADAATRSLGRLVLDASAVPFVDSTGLEALLDVADQLAQSGQALRVCGAGETLREVLDLTDLTTSFELFADAPSAVRSFL